ncbi:MAG: rod shape-determining protein MreD [Calditrichia bacterium]
MNNVHIKYIFFFIIALLLQITLVKYVRIFNWLPDLLLIVLVAYSLRKGANAGMTAGFLTGLIQDLLSTHFIGLSALAKTIAAFTAANMAGKFSARTEYFLALIVSALMHDLVYFLIYTLGENFSIQSLIFLYTIPNVMYTAIVGGVLYFVMENLIYE